MSDAVAATSNPGKQFVLGVDLDGVVANFYAGLLPIAAEWLGVPVASLPLDVSYGLTEWGLDAVGGYEDLHRFAVVQRSLFRKLEPMPGAPAALRRISQSDVRIRIITHRLYVKYFHEEAVTQTTAWLEHHGIPYWDLCFMKDKAAVGADLYIEDSPDNGQSLRTDGHETIVFRNSTNRHIAPPQASDWGDVERLVAEHQQRWRARLDARAVAGR
jgi:5'(3')-deoxyribonucleotidase